jgi:hypothetical protein
MATISPATIFYDCANIGCSIAINGTAIDTNDCNKNACIATIGTAAFLKQRLSHSARVGL